MLYVLFLIHWNGSDQLSLALLCIQPWRYRLHHYDLILAKLIEFQEAISCQDCLQFHSFLPQAPEPFSPVPLAPILQLQLQLSLGFSFCNAVVMFAAHLSLRGSKNRIWQQSVIHESCSAKLGDFGVPTITAGTRKATWHWPNHKILLFLDKHAGCSMWRCIISGPECLCFQLHPWLGYSPELGYSRGTNLEDTVSTILLLGKDFQSFFLVARSHHTIRHLQHTEISASTEEKWCRGLSLKAPPAISCTEDTPPSPWVFLQKHCYSVGFSPANKNQHSIVSSWQKLVKSTPHPSNQSRTNT